MLAEVSFMQNRGDTAGSGFSSSLSTSLRLKTAKSDHCSSFPMTLFVATALMAEDSVAS